MFRKAMQIDDDVIFRFFELLSRRSNEEIAALQREKAAGRNPMEIKALFAREIVERFHGAEAADARGARVRARLRRRTPCPTTCPTRRGSRRTAASRSSAGRSSRRASCRRRARRRRLVEQGGVEVDGARATDPQDALEPGKEYLVRVGSKNRRFARIRVLPRCPAGPRPAAEPLPSAADPSRVLACALRLGGRVAPAGRARPDASLIGAARRPRARRRASCGSSTPARESSSRTRRRHRPSPRVLPEDRLDAFAKRHGGIDLRQATRARPGRLRRRDAGSRRGRFDPAPWRRRSRRARCRRRGARGEVTAPSCGPSWGTVGSARQQIALLGTAGRRARAGALSGRCARPPYFARGKLHRALPALRAEPLARAAALLGDAPVRAFAPGPFEGEWAQGSRWLCCGGDRRRGSCGRDAARTAGPRLPLRADRCLGRRCRRGRHDRLEAAFQLLAADPLGR